MYIAQKILFGFILLLLMQIVLVIGFFSAVFFFAPGVKDLPTWLPVDLAIKSAAVLAVMLIVWLIWAAIAEYRFHKKELQALKQQTLNRFFAGSRDTRRSSYYPPND